MLNVLFSLLFTAFFSHGYTVAIDPGHGGMDHGAVMGKVKESQVVLGVSKYLNTLLNNDPQFKSFLVRDSDAVVDLHDRVRIAKKHGSELFVSIHANSSPDAHSQGMELYFRNELEPDEDSLRLASQENMSEAVVVPTPKAKRAGDLHSILQDLKRSENSLKSYELSWHILKNWKVPFSRVRQRAIKQGPFHVINQQEFPSVLVEIGFVTNPKEAQRLTSPQYQKEIAQSIYAGLKDYKGTLDKNQSRAISNH